jgi:2-hydroxychromene-2-carboxylate isomerase
MADLSLVRMYTDFKSPYSYLAFEPGLDLSKEFSVRVEWRPFQTKQRGAGERSTYSEFKFRYSWIDLNRWGASRGITFQAPEKIFDSTLALIGGLYADKQGRLKEYGLQVYQRFFSNQLQIEDLAELSSIISQAGCDASGFQAYASGPGKHDLEAAFAQAAEDKVFGAPFFIFNNEFFWGNDRLALLKRRLTEKGLALACQV